MAGAAGRDSDMGWQDNDDLTEPSEGSDTPIMGVTGGQRAAKGDTYTLTLHDDGEEVDTQNGTRAAFDATLESASFRPVDGDGNVIDAGDDVRFMTGSARFLQNLQQYDELADRTFEITVEGVGYDAAYTVEEVEE